MHVFLTGATGYIGSAVLDAMIKGGHRVTALARDPEKAERLRAKGATPIIGELGLPENLRQRREGRRRGRAHGDGIVAARRREGQAGARHDAGRADAGEPGRRQGARLHLHVRRLGAGPQRQGGRRGCAARSAAARRVAARRTKTVVLSAFSASLRTVVVRPGIVYGGGRGIVSDLIKDALNGLIRVVGPGQEPLAVHLRSRPRRSLRHAFSNRRRRPASFTRPTKPTSG